MLLLTMFMMLSVSLVVGLGVGMDHRPARRRNKLVLPHPMRIIR
jgi:hypothetical protein